MPRIYDIDDEIQSDGTSCYTVRDDLKYCMMQTDCVKVKKMTFRQCFQANDPSIPDECHRLKTLLFECKRSLLDNRTRFRGRKGQIY